MKVKCRNCKHAMAFGNNTCLCKKQARRVCACNEFGRICKEYEKRTGDGS